MKSVNYIYDEKVMQYVFADVFGETDKHHEHHSEEAADSSLQTYSHSITNHNNEPDH